MNRKIRKYANNSIPSVLIAQSCQDNSKNGVDGGGLSKECGIKELYFKRNVRSDT